MHGTLFVEFGFKLNNNVTNADWITFTITKLIDHDA
jgi:hypothetical protein